MLHVCLFVCLFDLKFHLIKFKLLKKINTTTLQYNLFHLIIVWAFINLHLKITTLPVPDPQPPPHQPPQQSGGNFKAPMVGGYSVQPSQAPHSMHGNNPHILPSPGVVPVPPWFPPPSGATRGEFADASTSRTTAATDEP